MRKIESYIIKEVEEYRKIELFLKSSDVDFIPRLSVRVDINSYAKKLAEYSQVYCIESDGELLALCAIYLNNHIQGYITSFNVSKSMQKQGYGSLLLQHVFLRARQQRYKSILLEVDKSNKPAILFYQKNGFKVVAERENWLVLRVNI